MEINDAIDFIKPAFPSPQIRKVWADLGCGKGVFTHALAMLLQDQSMIYAIDSSRQKFRPSLNGNTISFYQMNFEKEDLPLQDLHGILMANSIHYVSEKRTLIRKLKRYLKHEGKLLMIEYEMDTPNPWVPYPVPYEVLSKMLREEGFPQVQLLNMRDSIYGHGKMYVCAAEQKLAS